MTLQKLKALQGGVRRRLAWLKCVPVTTEKYRSLSLSLAWLTLIGNEDRLEAITF